MSSNERIRFHSKTCSFCMKFHDVKNLKEKKFRKINEKYKRNRRYCDDAKISKNILRSLNLSIYFPRKNKKNDTNPVVNSGYPYLTTMSSQFLLQHIFLVESILMLTRKKKHINFCLKVDPEFAVWSQLK
ncbi:hypothetical protein BpHYR1_038200 [Brachionus plicatilis]|uniref:Uncharacterized protein n=1 Tax=Brachionus plicatilis TaxID=10195 RepID=A0A3M7T9V6_BRAPC|nr:hypothetical protein BpHYR1_038200 [Brachionus plicatilis]